MMYAILFLIGLMSQSNVSVQNTTCDLSIDFERNMKYLLGDGYVSYNLVMNRSVNLNSAFARKTEKECRIVNDRITCWANEYCLIENNHAIKCVNGNAAGKQHYRLSTLLYNYGKPGVLTDIVIFPTWSCNPKLYTGKTRKERVYDYRGKCPIKETFYEFPECDKDYEFIRIENIEQKCIWRDNVYYRNDRNGQMYYLATENRKHGVTVQLKFYNIRWIDFCGLNCRRFKKYGVIKRNFSPLNQRVIWQSYSELIERLYYIRKNFAMGPYTDGFRILPYYVDDEKVGAIY